MQIMTDKDDLSVVLHGKEQLWAIRARVKVPKSTILSVRFEPKFQDWRKWEVRIPGTHIPRVLMAGSYWTEEGWDFLYVKKPRGLRKSRLENVLVVETDQNRYRRLIVSCDSKQADKIIKWWQKVKTGQSAKDKGHSKKKRKS
jgi:hypothetical protein